MKSFLIAAVLGLLFLVPQDASACSCVTGGVPGEPEPTPAEWLQNFDGAVFRGRIITIERSTREIVGVDFKVPFPERKLTFRVERQWKGVQHSEITVWTDELNSSCSVNYPLTTPLIILARWEPTLKRYQTDSCAWILFPGTEKDFLAALGEGAPPPK